MRYCWWMLTLILLTFSVFIEAKDGEKLYREALDALQGKDYATALNRFEAALRAVPDSLRYGSEYRMAVIESGQYDRCLAFFEQLVESHPDAAHAHLNLGFAHVDKIPLAGSITQVLLANTALKHFTRSIEVKPTWIGLYTRGNSYLFWPKIFNRAPLGVADLEKALQLQKPLPRRHHHQRTYVALGDGYYKMDDLEKARRIWQQGASLFPGSQALKERLGKKGEELQQLVGQGYDPNVRVDSNLKDLWSEK